MDKILITLYVPLLEANYDIFIPQSKTIGYTIMNIQKGICELSDENFIVSTKRILVSKKDGKVLDYNAFPSESNILNGDTLILL